MKKAMVKHEIQSVHAITDALQMLCDHLVESIGDDEAERIIKEETRAMIDSYKKDLFDLHGKMCSLPDKGNYEVETLVVKTSQQVIDNMRSQIRAV